MQTKKKLSKAELTDKIHLEIEIDKKTGQLFDLNSLKVGDDLQIALMKSETRMLEKSNEVKHLCDGVKNKLDKVIEHAKKSGYVHDHAIGHTVFVREILECYEAKLVSELQNIRC